MCTYTLGSRPRREWVHFLRSSFLAMRRRAGLIPSLAPLKMGKVGQTISRPRRLGYAVLGAVSIILILRHLTRARPVRHNVSLVLRTEPPFDTTSPSSLYSITPPDGSALRAQTDPAGTRTLLILPNSEMRCGYRYNYFCKFYFAIRCYMLAGFRDVRIADSVKEVQQLAKIGDVVLIPHRSKIHAEPIDLIALNAWRSLEEDAHGETNALKRSLRVGVFHICNEKYRDNWPWYVNADFVLRNYWISPMPRHAQYIPLGHQMPSFCTPESPEKGAVGTRKKWLPFLRNSPLTCSCGRHNFLPASRRPYLYTFSGSLRKQRAKLLKRIRGSKDLRGKGQILVARKFGGDGDFGTGKNDPKQGHLKSILDSAFVFAPCGNVMETHRIYEALALGAIPVIENCEEADTNAFFPLRKLVIDGGVEPMVTFVEGFVDQPEKVDALQKEVIEWWNHYAAQLAQNVSRTILEPVPRSEIIAP